MEGQRMKFRRPSVLLVLCFTLALSWLPARPLLAADREVVTLDTVVSLGRGASLVRRSVGSAGNPAAAVRFQVITFDSSRVSLVVNAQGNRGTAKNLDEWMKQQGAIADVCRGQV